MTDETLDKNGNNDKFEEEAELNEKGENETLMAGISQLMQEGLAEPSIAIPSLQSDVESSEEDEAEILVPNWLIEVLAFISRKEMANSSLSTSSKIFKLLCWPKLHKNVKPHKIPHLLCWSFRGQAQFRRRDTDEIIPIPSTPAPFYIDGIGKIDISFVDEQVINFVKSIERLLQNCNLFVIFKLNSLEKDKNLVTSNNALLDWLAVKIFKFSVKYYAPTNSLCLHEFDRIFPGILGQIQFLSFTTYPGMDDIQTILNWLTSNQSNGGKQKIIQFNFDLLFDNQKCMATFFDCIKEVADNLSWLVTPPPNLSPFNNTSNCEPIWRILEFSNSTSPSIFFISFADTIFTLYGQDIDEFTLENSRTNEILTFYRRRIKIGNAYHIVRNDYYMARYPKGEEHWKEVGWNKTLIGSSTTIIEINMY